MPSPPDRRDLVATDNELGAEEVVQHLIGLGHRRIGFVGVPYLSRLSIAGGRYFGIVNHQASDLIFEVIYQLLE